MHTRGNYNAFRATCPQTVEGGCTSDTTILRNVENLEFIYQDAAGTETTDYDKATIVKMAIATKISQSQHTIELSNSATFRLALTDTAPESPPSGSNVVANNIYAAHMNCGPNYNLRYGTLCPANPAPIATNYGNNISLTANSVCTPNTPAVLNQGSNAIISIGSFTTSCELPSTLPIFDKQALVGSIPATNIATGNITCSGRPMGSVVDLLANHRHVGDIDFSGGTCSGMITNGGVLYIDGELKLGFGSGIAIHPSVTDLVTIVVNGRVNVYNATIDSSSTPKPNIISFDSTNDACSHSDSCSSLSMQDLYSSGNSLSHGILVFHSQSEVYANFYAPFSRTRFTTSAKVETSEIYGQQVDIDHGHLGWFITAP